MGARQGRTKGNRQKAEYEKRKERMGNQAGEKRKAGSRKTEGSTGKSQLEAGTGRTERKKDKAE